MALQEIRDRFGVSRVLPPLGRRLPWPRDHRGEEQEPCHRDPRRDERAAERAEGLTNDDEIAAVLDGARHGVRVIAGGRPLVTNRRGGGPPSCAGGGDGATRAGD